MSVMSISDIQSRIQAIEQKFVTPPASGSSSAATTGSSANVGFADLLAAASELGTTASATGAAAGDGTSPSSSSALTSLLGSLTNSLGSSLGNSLGSTGSLNSIPGAGGTTAATGRNQVFLQSALAQTGDAYVWGASASPTDPNPTAFDCSELVKWAAKRAGVDLPDGSWLQYLQLKQQGATIPVEQALQTPGALLFSFSHEPTPGGGRPSHTHVAISLGNGKTIEARGRSYGVGSFDAANRFQYAAVVPGLTGA